MKERDKLWTVRFAVLGCILLGLGTQSPFIAIGTLLMVASINCWTQIRTPRRAPAKEEPKRLPYHGCFTGECPHDNANDCVSSLAQYLAELEGDDEKLRDENNKLRLALRRIASLKPHLHETDGGCALIAEEALAQNPEK